MALHRVQHRLLIALATMASGAMAQSYVPSPTGTLVDDASQVVLGRYTTDAATPTPSLFEPLDLVAQITYPRQTVATIGEALEHTLLRTGYALVDRAALGAEAQRFLALPLPEAQRTLGPFQVQAILNVLVGPAWTWHRDNIRRKVWFTIAPEFGPRRLEPIVTPVAATAKED